MASRKIYVIQDSVTGQYYVGSSTRLGEFENAIIHTTLNSVIAGVKKRMTVWRWLSKNGEDKESMSPAKQRVNLPNMGMVALEITIRDTGKKVN